MVENYNSTQYATYLNITGIDQPDLMSAIAGNDYLEYGIKTQGAIDGLYLDHFQQTKHGDASVATTYNYGYDIGIIVSDDNFNTYTIINRISSLCIIRSRTCGRVAGSTRCK